MSPADLGEECLRCTPRPLLAFWLRQGLPVPVLAIALTAFLFFAGMLTAPVMKVFDVPEPWSHQPIFWAVFLPWCAAFIFLFYIAPAKDCLILHKHGFRYRMNELFETPIRFDELQSILIGWDRGFSELTKLFGRLTLRNFDRLHATTESSTARLIRKDGREVLLKHLLIRFEEPDLVKFFQHVVDHHPGLITVPQAEG